MKQISIQPLTFTTSAVVVAYLLINDLDIAEQAAIGAWFCIVGDILAASSAWSTVLEERYESMNDNEIEILKKSIEKIQKILDDNNIRNNEVDENE